MQRWQVGGLTVLALGAGMIGGVIGMKLAQPPPAASAPARTVPYSAGSYAAPNYAAPARRSEPVTGELGGLLKDPSSAAPVPSISDRMQRQAEQDQRERMQQQLDQQKRQLQTLEDERQRHQSRDLFDKFNRPTSNSTTGSLFDKYNQR